MRAMPMRLGFSAFLLSCLAFPAMAAEDGAKMVDSAWSKAILANDLDAVMRTYAADAVAWLPNDAEAKGQAAIRAGYKAMLDQFTVKDCVLSNTVHRNFGNTAVGWGNFSLTLVPKAGGDPVVMTGRFTDVVERRNGHWVYVVDHASAEPPPAPPAEPAKPAGT
jgi:ketosteroid isomerase-like protein